MPDLTESAATAIEDIITGLTVFELETLIERATKEIDQKKREAVETLRAELAEKAEAAGVSFEDVVRRKFKHRKQRAQAQYRNPLKPRQTWSGKGKQPRWVRNLVESGKSLEDLRI